VLDSNNCAISKTSVITLDPYSAPNFYITPTLGNSPLTTDFVSLASPKPLSNWWFITNDYTNHTDTVITPDSVLHYTFTQRGPYTITLTPVLGWCTESLTKVGYVFVDSTLGVKAINQNIFNLWPNPVAKENVLLLNGEGATSIALYDAIGREIKVDAEFITTNKTKINTNGLAPGIYWLHIFINNNSMQALKFIINP
jgi:hypothetical protein